MIKLKRLAPEVLIAFLAAIPLFYALRMAYAAAVFPLELEVREGGSWLHVLAVSQGISVYDHAQVAFFGSHGAVDFLFKTLVHILFPSLPSQTIVRIFCLLMPFCVFAFAYQCTRSLQKYRWACALLLGAIVYVSIANLRSYNLLVGRPDPPSGSFLALEAAVAVRIFLQRKASLWLQILLNLFLSFALLAVWRVLPGAGAIWAIAGVAFCGKRPKDWGKFAGVSLAVFVASFTFILFTGYMGSLKLFYDHQFRFFFDQAGVGTHGEWDLIPPELWYDTTVRLAVMAPLAIIAFALMFQRGLLEYVAAAMTVLCFFAVSYGLHQNRGGGGVQYFGPFVLVAWLSVVAIVSSMKSVSPRSVLAALAVLVLTVPTWFQVWVQYSNLEAALPAAQNFRSQLEELDRRDEIMSETYHLYKTKLGNSIVDQGDGPMDMIKKNDFLGKTYSETAMRYFRKVYSGVYKYYLTGATECQETYDYLVANYKEVGVGPAYNTMNAPGGCVSLINCMKVWQKK